MMNCKVYGGKSHNGLIDLLSLQMYGFTVVNHAIIFGFVGVLTKIRIGHLPYTNL